MSKLYVDAVEPEGASTVLTLGTVGDTVNIGGTAGTGFPAGGFHQMVVRSTPGAATYSPAAGVTKLIVAVQGAGGGGGGGNVSYYGSGGAAGGYAEKFLTGVASTDVMTVTVGTGGGGGTAANGVAGTDSKFTSVSGGLHPFTEIKGTGGGMGKLGADPDAAGVGSAGGDFIRHDGQGGGDDVGGAYQGGDSMLGTAGKRLGTATTAAHAGVGYGSGGTGAYGVPSAVGADGRDGVVIIWEYK